MTGNSTFTGARNASARRLALALLAALAVTAGAAGAIPAESAHAGGLSGGVVGSNR